VATDKKKREKEKRKTKRNGTRKLGRADLEGSPTPPALRWFNSVSISFLEHISQQEKEKEKEKEKVMSRGQGEHVPRHRNQEVNR
jgi:hypothetical protein